jgi:hypothetical protein
MALLNCGLALLKLITNCINHFAKWLEFTGLATRVLGGLLEMSRGLGKLQCRILEIMKKCNYNWKCEEVDDFKQLLEIAPSIAKYALARGAVKHGDKSDRWNHTKNGEWIDAGSLAYMVFDPIGEECFSLSGYIPKRPTQSQMQSYWRALRRLEKLGYIEVKKRQLLGWDRTEYRSWGGCSHEKMVKLKSLVQIKK